MPRKKSTSDEFLLDTARDVFLSDGIGASTKKIADAASVSEGVLFQRFGSKQRLFFAAMRLAPTDFNAAIEASKNCANCNEALLILASEALLYLRTSMPRVLLVLSHPARKELFKHHSDDSHDLLFESSNLASVFEAFFNSDLAQSQLRQRDFEQVSSLLLSALLTRAFHEQMGIDEMETATTWLKKIIATLLD